MHPTNCTVSTAHSPFVGVSDKCNSKDGHERAVVGGVHPGGGV